MGCKEIEIRKSEFVAKTQFLCSKMLPEEYQHCHGKGLEVIVPMNIGSLLNCLIKGYSNLLLTLFISIVW